MCHSLLSCSAAPACAETNQVTFSAWPSLTAPTTTNINKVDVSTGAVTPITLDAPLGSPVGANNGASAAAATVAVVLMLLLLLDFHHHMAM